MRNRMRNRLRNRRRAATVLLLIAIGTGCAADDSNSFRGRGLTVAALGTDDQASIYRAALRAAFELDDPTLSLLLDPRFLPRTAGLGDGTPMPAALADT